MKHQINYTLSGCIKLFHRKKITLQLKVKVHFDRKNSAGAWKHFEELKAFLPTRALFFPSITIKNATVCAILIILVSVCLVNAQFCLLKMSREQLVVQQARKAFQTGRSKPLYFRVEQLKNLQRFISERQHDITDALKKDLCKVNFNWQ